MVADYTARRLRAALRAPARLRRRLRGAHEGARELAVGDVVDAPAFEIDLAKSSRRQLAPVVVLLERAGDAPDPRLGVLADVGRHVAANNHVGDGEAAAGLLHAERLAQHGVLVG